MKRLFGLIGYPLSHSFSKRYFADKFEREGITDCYYDAFPIEDIQLLPALIANHPNLVGLNVTIPYKQQVIPFLQHLEEGAIAVGAVNTIKISENGWWGFNSDVYGFYQSLNNALSRTGLSVTSTGALILGTGGAAKAVQYVLQNLMNMPYISVSRNPDQGQLSYDDLDREIMDAHRLIINTTPLGMMPNTHTFPDIPYHFLTAKHLVFDLVYNPEKTLFLLKSEKYGAKIQNGLEMLYLQAESSWAYWNKELA